MSPRTILVAILAVLFGVSAVIVAYQFRVNSTRDDSAPVLTAKTDVTRGTVLSPELVNVSYYHRRDVPKGALAAVEDLAGRTVLFPLSQGEPIVENRLTDQSAGRGLAAMIPDGMRAFTIETPHAAAGVGGFLRPGDKVDVLLTTTPSGQDDATGGGITTTLLQNVQLLAVAQKLDSPDDGKDAKDNKSNVGEIRTVTLLVTPDQAAKLDLGMNKGVLHLALRNPKDGREANTRPATMAQLRYHQEKPSDFGGMLAKAVGVAGRFANGMSARDKDTMGEGDIGTYEPAGAARPQPPAQIWTLRGSRAGVVLVNNQH